MATTDKIRKDIAKTKEKISQLQTKLRTLETQLTEEENLEIVRMVKAVKMDNRELTAFLRAYKSFLFFGSAIKKNINWGANHGAISYGHVGADLITLCSMLRIPVCMHNVPEQDIFRPAAWNAFGMDKEGQDYRACAAYGPMYKNTR